VQVFENQWPAVTAHHTAAAHHGDGGGGSVCSISSSHRSRRSRRRRRRYHRGPGSMLLGRFFGCADAATLVEVRVVKEPGEQHQVTEVHGRRQGDVELGHAA